MHSDYRDNPYRTAPPGYFSGECEEDDEEIPCDVCGCEARYEMDDLYYCKSCLENELFDSMKEAEVFEELPYHY